MKNAITLFLASLVLLGVSVPSLALVEVEDYDNLPPPMAVTYESVPPPAVVVMIPAYTPAPTEAVVYAPVKQTSTFTPAATPTSTSAPAPPADIKGDYTKGTVYGPSLSTNELKGIKAKVSEVVAACVTEGMTDREKIIALVNYVYDHCEYAPDWSKNRANTAWGLLVYGEAQCSGYARGMVALFDAVGIESRYVHAAKTDPINSSHQWNMVKLDGKWYHLDVQMLDSSYGGTNKPILLMESHLTYDESKYPKVTGESLTLQ